MRILIIGSGTREQVLTTTLAASGREPVLVMGTGAADAGRVQVISAAPDPIAAAVAVFKHRVDLVILDPSLPGADRIAAALAVGGTACIGAGTFATRAALSRAWTLEFLADNLIPVAPFAAFDDPDTAAAHALKARHPLTVSTTQSGTGDIAQFCRTARDTVEAINALTGEGNRTLLLQPAHTGPEAVLTGWTDGTSWSSMPTCRDLHQVGNGPVRIWALTACSPEPVVTPGLERIISDTIITPFHTALAARHLGHRGPLTFRVALTPTGPRVLDLYPGLTDAHAPVALPLLHSDPVELLEAVAAGRLGEVAPEWSGQHLVSLTGTAAASATAAPAGDARWGRDVAGTAVYDGGVRDRDCEQRLTVVGAGPDFKTARNRAFARAAWIHHDSALTRARTGASV